MAGPKRRVNIAGERSPGEAHASFAEQFSGIDSRAEETALFREATRGVRPLEHDRHVAPSRKPAPAARFKRAARTAILDESPDTSPDESAPGGGEAASFARPGVQKAVLLRLRRGHYRVQAELDLHGLTAREANEVLRDFLAEALARNVRCVRIIHGKGLRSGSRGPVLKVLVTSLLRRSSRVLAFVSARGVDGGTGAVYALLSPP